MKGDSRRKWGAVNLKTIGEQVRIAIICECSAPKLGNVHPGASFRDMSYESFCRAADAIGKSVDDLSSGSPDAARRIGVGEYCLAMVESMMSSAKTNTSLGTILLMAPLIVASQRSLSLCSVLEQLNGCDAALVYTSIQLANPGGLGKSSEMDVGELPPQSLLEAMRFASPYDDVALQYVSEFRLVEWVAARIASLSLDMSVNSGLDDNRVDGGKGDWGGADFGHIIQRVQVEILAQRVDSLIVRKSGINVANELQRRCLSVLETLRRGEDWRPLWQETDEWARSQQSSNGKQLINPGTTADLIAAAIFVCMQKQLCNVPSDESKPLLFPS